MWPFSSPNIAVVTAKREQRTRALATAKATTNSASDLQYLRATTGDIVSNIESGKWTASQVIEAYITRAAYAQAKTNCLTEVFFDRARQQAAELDAEFAVTGKVRGPLHGVPVSFKDQFEIVGLDNTTGYSQWANKPAAQNADLINQLIKAGAVPFVKTNLSQCMFYFESTNPVWGRSLNPYNDAFTCGGSSGGEAALIAMDGSALGFGSDVGGSIRTPAAYCGIYSLTPGDGRISFEGATVPNPGFEGLKAVAGPMGRSVDDLVRAAKTLLGLPSTRHDIAPLPFREVVLPSKLKFGYLTTDYYVKASPACKRAVLETVEALRKQGHECVEISIPTQACEATNILLGLTSADGFDTMLSHLGPDKKEDGLFLVTLGPQLPWLLKKFVSWILKTAMGDKIFSENLMYLGKKSVGEYWALSNKRHEFITRFYREIWDAHGLDGIIAPVQAIPQLPHGGCTNSSALAVATYLWNVLDMPAGCLPVTRVDASKDQITPEWEREAGHGSPVVEGGVFYGINAPKLYEPDNCHGMPINIQVVGKRWEEEKVLGMMDIIDEALGRERGFGPGAWDRYQAANNV